MFSIASENKYKLPDVAQFVEKLNYFQQETEFFDEQREIFVSRAPGRLDLMGGIADYSGSLVLQFPIREATMAALQKDASPVIRIVSLLSENEVSRSFSFGLDDLRTKDFNNLRETFKSDPQNSWAAYIVGIFAVLFKEGKIDLTEGARIFIFSNVPEGKGVSSSAALEVAVMQSVKTAFNLALTAYEIALLCQKTENEIVGAPCGVMDQMVSMCGAENKLLPIVCQPATLFPTVNLPDELDIWGIDSGIRHSVAGTDYGSVRVGAFMGYRMIAAISGFKVSNLDNEQVKIFDDKWHGYLANISPSEFENDFCKKLPEKISGFEFLKIYHGTNDRISKINPDGNYFVLKPTAHPIYENWRVSKFAELLGEQQSKSNFECLGNLMFQSHNSYSTCGLGSDGTDILVEMVKDTNNNLFGAKITGGGSGGTVAILGRKGEDAKIEQIAVKYAEKTGRNPRVFSGSSSGADNFGSIKLTFS